MGKTMKILLASSSKERKKIISRLIKIKVVRWTGKIRVKYTTPANLTKKLAYFKALKVALKNPKNIIIGADTTAYLNKKIISKPKNKIEAKKMLLDLSAKKVYFYTGVCLVYFDGKNKPLSYSYSQKAMIKFKKFSYNQIKNYIKNQKDITKRACAININNPIIKKLIENKLTKNQTEIISGIGSKMLLVKLKEFKQKIKKLKIN
jgi:septum formation protein